MKFDPESRALAEVLDRHFPKLRKVRGAESPSQAALDLVSRFLGDCDFESGSHWKPAAEHEALTEAVHALGKAVAALDRLAPPVREELADRTRERLRSGLSCSAIVKPLPDSPEKPDITVDDRAVTVDGIKVKAIGYGLVRELEQALAALEAERDDMTAFIDTGISPGRRSAHTIRIWCRLRVLWEHQAEKPSPTWPKPGTPFWSFAEDAFAALKINVSIEALARSVNDLSKRGELAAYEPDAWADYTTPDDHGQA